jgi:hypothetical protein
MTAFCGLGEWKGVAEVYGGDGRFLGNGVDQRHIRTPLGDNRIRIDLSFVGPFRFSGHYEIVDKGSHRVYAGPANLGIAEAVSADLVDADHYWTGIGLSQRFFLMMLPGGTRQLSLALMSRGERLIYAVVGENERAVLCETPNAQSNADSGNVRDAEAALSHAGLGDASHEAGPNHPPRENAEAARNPLIVDGTSFDLAADPAAGRGAILLHRRGTYRGTLARTNGQLEPIGEVSYEETVEPNADGRALKVRVAGGGFAPEPATIALSTDGVTAWSSAGPMAGSYSMFGGRALSGTFQRVRDELRVWRREVVSHDGALKAVVHNWYRGGVRVGVEHGVLAWSPSHPKGAP